ncbi:MAG: TonB-dependent receptor plug domain-containing protein, partial [Porticoccaceae bacterium]
MNLIHSKRLRLAVAVAGAMSAGIAQTAEIDEIVVTANKREQSLQDVPVTVSVTSGETIQRAAIVDILDLQTSVPSLRVNQLQSSAQTNFTIRGYGNGANNPGIEPAVSVYIDGVPRTRTASALADLPTVERIEVLSGPQSTLFGKNASAGVISVSTMLPEDSFGGMIEATGGNYGARI